MNKDGIGRMLDDVLIDTQWLWPGYSHVGSADVGEIDTVKGGMDMAGSSGAVTWYTAVVDDLERWTAEGLVGFADDEVVVVVPAAVV